MNLIQPAFQPVSKPSLKTPEVALWFIISLIFPLYFGLISYFHATTPYLVQDDARLHIVWLQRLTNPALFPNDIIADYFGIIQPAGFKWLYAIAASLGIEALTFAKILPLALALIATVYLFWVALMILPVPANGFLTTLLLNQNIWIRDDLISAAPRAFVYPLFAAFLYYLLQNTKIGYLIALLLLGLFYPQMMLVAMAVLTLQLLVGWASRPSFWWDRRDAQPARDAVSFQRATGAIAAWLIALILTGGILLIFSHQVAQQVGPLATLEDMMRLPEFQLNGRGEYFGVPFLSFLFDGSSGLRFPLFPPIILLGALLPIAIWQAARPEASGHLLRFSLAPQITARVGIIAQLFVCAIALFLLAHLIFPTLYLPSRYTFYSLRFVLILSSGLMLTLVACNWWRWVNQKKRRRNWHLLNFVKVISSLALAIAILITPAIPALFLGGQGWVSGQPAGIFQHIARSPRDSLIASLVTEINDNVPAFSQRSILVGREFALPFHTDFYAEMQQRAEGLVRSQYTSDSAVLQAFIQTSGLDLWIIAKDFATPAYLNRQTWLINSSMASAIASAKTQLQEGIQPALASTISTCSTYSQADLIVLDAQCIIQTVN